MFLLPEMEANKDQGPEATKTEQAGSQDMVCIHQHVQ